MMRFATAGLVLASITLLSIGTESPERVTCTATKGFHCANSEGGCRPDRAYTITFTVDRAGGTVVDSKGQVYKIGATRSMEALGPPFEYAIQATAQVGLAATETVVLGEKSFVSSNVSVAPPRAFIQVGTCSGFRRP